MHNLNRQDIPPNPGPEMIIRRLKAGKKVHVLILSSGIWGIWCHWSGQKSEPCFREKKECSGCKRGLPKRWKGYLHSYDFMDKRDYFEELTPIAAQALLGQFPQGESLRGHRIVLERGGGDKARLKVTLMGIYHGEEPIPAEKCPQSTLQKLWGMDQRIVERQEEGTLPLSDAI